MILDVGPKTAAMLGDLLRNAGTIVWNGPVGVFEMAPYAEGTKALADAIAEATERGAFSIAGGGDTVAAVSKFGVADRVSYISTAPSSSSSKGRSSPPSQFSKNALDAQRT